MKKIYEQPEVELLRFEIADVITESDDPDELPSVPGNS